MKAPAKVSDLMSPQVATCRPSDSLSRAAQAMWDGDCGAVVVVDEAHRPVGMLTDRDACMATWSQDRPPTQIPVNAVMARDVVSCTLGQDIGVVHEVLRQNQLHRVPVVDTAGALVGIVSLSDLVHRGGAQHGAAAPVHATLAAITKPRDVTSARAEAGAAPAEPVAVIPAKAPVSRPAAAPQATPTPAPPAKAPTAHASAPQATAPKAAAAAPQPAQAAAQTPAHTSGQAPAQASGQGAENEATPARGPKVGRKVARNIPAKKASAKRKKK